MNITPGSMIMNSANNQNYGTVVNNLGDRIVVFRLEKDTYPVFSKIKNHPYIRKTGTINEHKNELLKSALLKYISSNQLSENEQKQLHNLIQFAFPLGVPAYRPDIELPERDQENLDLASHLNIGKKLFLNTPQDSPYRFLNNAQVDVVDLTDNGIWVVKPSADGEDANFFLFYKNKETPNFSGISRINPLGEESKYMDRYIEKYKMKNHDKQLPTTMIHDGEKVKVMPDSGKVIFPIKYQNMVFKPTECKFAKDKTIKLPEEIKLTGKGNMDMMGDYDFSEEKKRQEEKGLQLLIGGATDEKTKTMAKMALERDDTEENYTSALDTDSYDSSVYEMDDDYSKRVVDIDADELINLPSTIAKSKKEKTDDKDDKSEKSDETGDDTDIEETSTELDDLDEEEYDFVEEDEVEEKGTFQKIKRIEVDESEKIYKESIQKGDLYKYKLEKVPRLRRNDPAVLDKIHKHINIISLLKHKVTNDDNTIKFQPENFNPLLEKYANKDFTNNLLIPLVLNKKTIYIEKDAKITAADYDPKTTNPVENYYKRIKEINSLIEKPHVNYDNIQSKIVEFMNPNEVNTDNIGLMFKLGEGIPNNNMERMAQHALTVRYCGEDYNCQSFQLQANDFDCQMSLGPIGRYLPDESDKRKDMIDEEDIDIEKENVEDNINYTLGKVKIMYPGDTINVIGFVRPPLEYLNNKKDDEAMNLQQMYADSMNSGDKKDDKVVVITLDNMDEDGVETGDFNLLDNPDKFVFIKFTDKLPHNLDIDADQFKADLNKIVPSIEQILTLYNKDIVTLKDAYDVLSNFEYETGNMDIIKRKEIYGFLEKRTLRLENNLKVIDQKYRRKQRKDDEAKEKEEAEGDKEIKTKCKIVDDELFEELLKYYYDVYGNLHTDFDDDIERISWFNNRLDNGNLMLNSMILNYYLKCQSDNQSDDLIAKLNILKEEYEKIKHERPPDQVDPKLAAEKRKCKSKEKPKIIKYPSTERLYQDNQKVITDSDGEIILPGDYALIKIGAHIELYKRKTLNDGDIWVKEELSTLHRLINESKEGCEGDQLFELDGDDVCLYDEEKLVCNPIDIIKIDKDLNDLEAKIVDLQSYIDFVDSLPDMIKVIRAQLKEEREMLTHNMDNEKRYWKDKLLQFKLEEEEIAKTIVRLNDCIHFNVSDYFNNIPASNTTLEERFSLANSIFDKFLNTEIDYDVYKIEREDTKNWTKCNICDQDLLCKHYLYGVELRKQDREFDYDKFIDIYGVEQTESYYCKICGEFLGTTNMMDIDEFAGGGEDGKRAVTREVVEDTPMHEVQVNELEKRISNLAKDQEKGDQYELGIDIYKLLKLLTNNKNLRIEDEKEMINFIEHFEFIKKSHFKNTILKKYGAKISNKMILSKLINKYYYIYYIVDIAARLLIILQTSEYLYNISNKMIKSNYMGYPTINDTSSTGRDGVHLMVSLIEQIGSLDKYSYLNDKDANIESKLMERLKYQIDNSEYLRNKIINAVIDKVEAIDDAEAFKSYITNTWIDFRPALKVSVSWTPPKVISKSSLGDLNSKNYRSMVNVTQENFIHEIFKLMKYVNNIVNGEDIATELTRRTNSGNSCCKTGIDGNDNYMTYFVEKNKSIDGVLNHMSNLLEIKNTLEDKMHLRVYHMLFAPIINLAMTQLKLNLEPKADEIKQLFMKYIHTGEHMGEIHVFNSYGQCMVSGIQKEEKEQSHFDLNQFINLYNIIKRKHQVFPSKNNLEDYGEKTREDDEEINVGNEADRVRVEEAKISVDEFDKMKVKSLEDEYVMIQNIIDLLSNEKDYPQFTFIRNYMKMMISNGFTEHLHKFDQDSILARINSFRNELAENKDYKSLDKDEFVIVDDESGTKSAIKLSDLHKGNVKQGKKFDVNKHIALLNSQVNNDIDTLMNKLNLTDKERKILGKQLDDIGEYVKHANEFERAEMVREGDDENKVRNKVDEHRYKLRENGIKKDLKFLKDILNQINNGRLENIDDKNSVRFQYRDFIRFGKNKVLFKGIKEYIDVFFRINNMLIGREQYTVLNTENTSGILHYMTILCYLSMYNYLYDNGLMKKYGKMGGDEDSKTVIIDDYDMTPHDIERKIVADDLDDVNEEKELIRHIEIDEEDDDDMDDKMYRSTNLSIIVEFLKTYFIKIFSDQEAYDSLTSEKIDEVMADHQQRQQERNLKIFSFLQKEGHEEDHNMILNKLAIGKLGYKDLSEYMGQVYGDTLFEVEKVGDMFEDDNVVIEAADQGMENFDDNERKDNELGLLKTEMDEIGFAGDPDEGMEDQDYGYMVGDYD